MPPSPACSAGLALHQGEDSEEDMGTSTASFWGCPHPASGRLELGSSLEGAMGSISELHPAAFSSLADAGGMLPARCSLSPQPSCPPSLAPQHTESQRRKWKVSGEGAYL